MRIISEFKDYYDSLQAYGIEQDITYVRETEKKDRRFDFDDGYLPSKDRHFNWNAQTAPFVKGVVGYCGEIFPVLFQIYPSNKHEYRLHRNLIPADGSYANSAVRNNLEAKVLHCFYSADECAQFINEENKTYPTVSDDGPFVRLSDYHNPYRRKWQYDIDSMHIRCRNYTERFKGDCPKGFSLKELFVEYRVPVFLVIDRLPDGLILNPCLKDLGFAKVKTPYEAYADIRSFVSGVLGAAMKPIPEIDDVTLAEAKGFNKFSFRKEKKAK